MTFTSPARSFGIVAAALAALVLVALPPALAQDDPIFADLDLVVDEIADPVEVSLLYSRNTFQSADEAVIATSFDGADALASGSLQSGVGGATATTVEGTDVEARPLFFVEPLAGPEQALFDELERLGVTSVILLGGESALPPEVQTAFEQAGITDVQRLSGPTRIGTAVAVAEFVLANSDTTTAYLSRAFGTATDRDTAYADSTALGGWAADTGNPILLTATEELSQETMAFLQQGGIERVEIVGGPAAVSDDIEQTLVDMDLEVNRTDGATRDETATAVAGARGFDSAEDADRVIVTEGFAARFFVNAFAAAAHSGVFNAPIVLTNGDEVAPAAQSFLGGGEAFALADSGLIGVCGTDVPAPLCSDLAEDQGATAVPVTLEDEDDGEEPGPAEQVGDYTVTPREDTTVQVAIAEDRTGEDDDAVQYTATGLDPDELYRITLVVADNITIEDDQATFVDEDDSTPDESPDDNDMQGNGAADAGPSEDVALITAVNGTEEATPAKTSPDPTADPQTMHEPNDDGEITFTVDGVEDSNGGTVYPVIYVNGGETTFLEVDSDGNPTELYGVGGAFIADATIGALEVTPHTPTAVGVDVVTGEETGEADDREYMVTGLDPETPYRITLVPDENITFTDGDDAAMFVEQTDDNDEGTGLAASAGAENTATIISVNGTELTEDDVAGNGRTTPAEDGDGVFPDADGVITFTIDGTDLTLDQAGSCANPDGVCGTIRPVVYVNGGQSTFLEIDADGVPTEVYGVGGAFSTTPGLGG